MKCSPATGAFVALLCAASSFGQSEGGAAAPLVWPKLAELRVILADAADYDETLARVEPLGPETAATVWGLATGQVLDDLDVSDDQRAAIIDAFDEWSPRSVVRSLKGAARADTPLDARLMLVEMLTSTEHEDALPAVLEVLADVSPLHFASPRVDRAIGTSLVRLLDGHPRRFNSLSDCMRELPIGLLRPIVRTAGELHMTESTLVFTRAVSLSRGLETDVLEQLSRRTFVSGEDTLLECAALVRGYLDDDDPKRRRHAAMAVGKLGDVDSFRPLVELLADEDASVRRVALLGLQELTGIGRGWSDERWHEWWTAQSAWIDEAEGDLPETLSRGTAFDARAALQDIETHPLFAARLAEVASYGLRHEDAHIRASTCGTLARVGGPHGVRHLISALDDSGPGVHGAALAGLRAITGADHGPATRDWAEWWAGVR